MQRKQRGLDEVLNMLIGPVADLAGTWLEGKVEEKKAQSATKVAKAQAEAVVMQKKATGEIDWDLEMAKGSQSSWKDEWLTILFSIPLILAFIVGLTLFVVGLFAIVILVSPSKPSSFLCNCFRLLHKLFALFCSLAFRS